MKSKKIDKKKLCVAFDGYSASGKSLGAKLISKKYKLKLLNSGLLYRYAAYLILKNKPNRKIPFLRKKFATLYYSDSIVLFFKIGIQGVTRWVHTPSSTQDPLKYTLFKNYLSLVKFPYSLVNRGIPVKYTGSL